MEPIPGDSVLVKVPLLPKFQGSVIANPNFDADVSAQDLRDAMEGFGTNDRKLISVLTHHTNEQRQAIETTYNEKFGRVLRDDFKSELSGHYEDICLALMDPPAVYDCKELHRAIERLGTDESTLVEILFTRSAEEICKIKEQYEALYEVTLDMALASDTSGDFLDLLKCMINGERETTVKVNRELARQDAQELYAAGEGRFGTSERRFNNILCTRSFFHLREMCVQYNEIAGHDIEEAIESETSGCLCDAYKAIVRMGKSLPGYFAYRAHKSMKGLGTKDLNLIRILISRSEIDMVQVRQEYEEKYETSLADAICSETMGDYEEVLLALIGHRMGS